MNFFMVVLRIGGVPRGSRGYCEGDGDARFGALLARSAVIAEEFLRSLVGLLEYKRPVAWLFVGQADDVREAPTWIDVAP
ncbi:hypothetical protein WBG06_23595 [Nocardioides sp. CCNWLW239]